MTIKAQEKYNVLFIACDDLRTDLGCYGNDLVKSPHIDQLAREGVLFDKAYCQQALCAPSRISVMTGRRPDNTRSWNLTAPIRRTDDVVTLPEQFKKNGYFTQDIGKIYHNWHVDGHADYPESWSVEPVMHYGTHNDDVPQVRGKLPENTAGTKWTKRLDVPDEAYYDGRIAQKAVEALQGFSGNPGQPFFLAVGFWKPHLPFNAPEKYWDMYDKDLIPAVYNGDPPKRIPEIALHDSWEFFRGEPNTLSESDVLELRHGYLAAVSFLDAQVGKVLSELKRLQLDKNTIVVFWSDHGFQLGEHSLWGKNSNFENDARVPFIISVPGEGMKGHKTGSLAELLDIYPTLLELCGIEEPEGIQGKSLVPVLKDGNATVNDAVFTQHPRPMYYKGKPDVMGYSVRTDRWRYTEWLDFDTREIVDRELYDHYYDDKESINLAREKRFRKVVDELHRKLQGAIVEPLVKR
ncbi:iduronate sulfatase [Sinomicrobium soli]|nr:iduronate sulfatase [Sinomicrobium sp. N-1-3-6]